MILHRAVSIGFLHLHVIRHQLLWIVAEFLRYAMANFSNLVNYRIIGRRFHWVQLLRQSGPMLGQCFFSQPRELVRRTGNGAVKIILFRQFGKQPGCEQFLLIVGQFFRLPQRLVRVVWSCHHLLRSIVPRCDYSSPCQSGCWFEPSFVRVAKSSSPPSTRCTQTCQGPSGVGARQKRIMLPSGE